MTGRPGSGSGSDFSLLRDLQGVIHLDAEVTHGGLELEVTQKQLHGARVLRSPIDERRLGPPPRVRAVLSRVKAKFLDPAFEDSGVLTRPQVWRVVNAVGNRKSSDFSPADLIGSLSCLPKTSYATTLH